MSDGLRRYVVGLGANLGDRLATLIAAVGGLRGLGSVLLVSDVYETAAVGPPQPDYLNAAVLLESRLEPLDLLDALLALERAHGRERRERWGARTLDLDLLYSPGLTLSTPRLALPHPELGQRAFAMRPLLDVLPEARDPVSGAAYTDLLAAIRGQDIRRLETRTNWCSGRAE